MYLKMDLNFISETEIFKEAIYREDRITKEVGCPEE